jgi:SAM-dependent methyltransferase
VSAPDAGSTRGGSGTATEASAGGNLITIPVQICPDPVFVIGSPRSGTSVLPWALAHHWDFWTSDETEFIHGLFGEGQAGQVYAELCLKRRSFITTHGIDHREFLGSLGLGINALISSRSKGGRWIDQSPGYTTMAWHLADMFPGSYFIHVLRDGRAVVNSMLHFREREGADDAALPAWANDFETAVRTWKHYVEFALDFCERNSDRCLTVKNEDLVERTDDEFARIFDFLGARHNAEPAGFFRASRVNSSFKPLVWGSGQVSRPPPEDHPYGPAARAWGDWSAEQRATFTEIAGELLDGLGYPSDVERFAEPSIELTCNICGAESAPSLAQLGRDVSSCPECKSTPRVRSVVHVLSNALFGRSLALPEFPDRPELKGIGLTDWGYDRGLAGKVEYRNTFYDHEPRLDITDPPEELCGTLDFLISSDVFEHVPPPVERAFEGAFRLLKPGGVFVLTVPYLLEGKTLEHFPTLHDWELRDGVLFNRTADGREEVFEDVRFHGGEGLTVEMRIFSHADVIRQLREAGFVEIEDWRERVPEFGECWFEDHSFPFVARRPLT